MAVIERTNVVLGDTELPGRMTFNKAGALAGGDFNGSAPKGAVAIDTTNGKHYINTGTKAATVWTVTGTQV